MFRGGVRAALLRRHWPLLPILALALAVRLWFGPQVREDAFITLRYVQNLLSGNGFVYNPGEPVLGTSTPLFALLLAGVAMFGVPIEAGAVAAGIASDLASITLLYAIGLHIGRRDAGLLAGIIYGMAAPVVAYSVSGMETPLYIAAILSAFLAWDSGRQRTAGLIAGAVAILRPEGLLVGGILAAADIARRRRFPWQLVVFTGLALLPWVLFATMYFGSPVPQSIVAKAGLLDDRWLSLRNLVWYFTDLDERRFLLLTAAFLVGLTSKAVRSQLLRACLAWEAAYALAFTLFNGLLYPVWPFEWYFLPLLPPFFLVSSLGILRLARLLRVPAVSLTVSAATVLFLGAYLPVLVRQHDYLVTIVNGREALYRDIARMLLGYGARTDLVAAPEIGAVGYFYPGPILDLNGLVSPVAVGRSYLELIRAYGPAWIVSYDTLVADDWNRADWLGREYRPVRELMNWETRRATLYRRYSPPQIVQGRGMKLGSLAWLEDYVTQLDRLPDRQILRVRLVWRGQKPSNERYTIFVHLLDKQGNLLAQQDNEPQEGTRPTTTWGEGELVADYFDLIPGGDADLKGGSLSIGAYMTGRPFAMADWTTRGETALGSELRLPVFREVARDSPCRPQFGPVRLQDVRLASTENAGQAKVSLLWQASAPIDKDYTVFIHFLNAEGNIVLQNDGQPANGALPTSTWAIGELVRDDHLVPLDPRVAAERLAVGMYDLRTGRRLALDAQAGVDTLELPLSGSTRLADDGPAILGRWAGCGPGGG